MPLQKPSRSKQDYGTPPEFLAAVKRALGITAFAHDFAASPHNATAESYWTHVSKRDNSLTKSDAEWRNAVGLWGWGWLNPPFAHIAPWVEKCAELSEHGHVALLVPASVGSNWFRDYVHAKAWIMLLNGRITFTGETQPYPKDCILALYGPDVTIGYEVWSWRTQGAPNA